ncbi:hypothetical protein KZX46_21745 (plasmid) [Polymorphobacter sp. PAMC 29334]|uniref:hypothetical protein n=1 Tax=Polymorphobacter sp. PAMC 29334 TaxID=2862331 RepID=UPI001C76BA9A|nr:hypothetical protein [Polymorphobacter sp. PAMC 29334]QYE37306.1 hypothetical protein KZX46_21745 [Polymorphobacter sp. PAMC 29334]
MESRSVLSPYCDGDALGVAEARIAAVRNHPATSQWLRDALGGALGRDPVDVLDDADALRELLCDRTAAAVDLMIDSARR